MQTIERTGTGAELESKIEDVAVVTAVFNRNHLIVTLLKII
jgi:hypothetical protein